MTKYEVIKAHDGLAVGTVKVMSASPLCDYMVKNGYWRVVEDKPKKSQLLLNGVKATVKNIFKSKANDSSGHHQMR